MKKIIKICVYLILSIVLIVALAIGGIVFFVNPNQFKPQITELVQKNANVILTIDGDIEWTFYPWLGIKVQDISVASPNTPTVPFAKIQLAQASILLKSLFNRELNMSDVVVNGLSVSLLKDGQGNTNWELTETQSTTNDVKQTKEAKVATESSQATPNLYVKSININNANFVYKDAQSNQALALNDLTLSSGEVMIGQPIAIKMQSKYALFNPKLEGEIKLSSVIDFNSEQQSLQVRDLQIDNNVSMNDLQLATKLTGILDMDLKGQLIQLSNLSVINNGKLDDLFINNLQVKGLVKADLGKEIVNVDQLQVSMDDLLLTGSVIAEQYSTDNLKFTSKISSNDFNLKALLTKLNIVLPEFESKTALQKASVQLSINGGLQHVDVNPIAINVDNTKITGSAAISLDKIPTIALALKGDQLVLNQYLPPKQVTKNTSTKIVDAHPTTAAPKNPDVIPILPNTINVIADIQWNSLTLDQLQLTNNRLKGSLKNGNATLDQLVTNIYGGALSFNGSLNSGKVPKLVFNGNIQNIDLTKIIPQIALKDYINSDFLLSKLNKNHKDISVEGVINGKFAITTSGRKQNDVIANLGGTANFDLSKGRINNLNYEKLMCQGIAVLNRKTLTDSFNRNYTDFQKLSGQFVIRNGIITNDPLQMNVPGLAMKGKGDVNLNRMTVNYRMNAVLTGDQSISADPACQINQRFKGIGIPLICEGSLEKADNLCRLDSDQLGKIAVDFAVGAVKDKAQKELDQQKGKVQDKLEGEIEKQIKKNPAIKGILKNIL